MKSSLAKLTVACIAWWALAGLSFAQELLPDPTLLDELPPELQMTSPSLAPRPITDVAASEEDAAAARQSALSRPVEGFPAPVKSSGSWLRLGEVYFDADAVFLQKSSFDDTLLAHDTTLGSLRELRIDRSAPMETSLRTTIGLNLFRDGENRQYSTEMTFFGLGFWENQGATASAQSNFLVSDLDGFIGGFNGADAQDYLYTTDFDSIEWNARITQRLGRDRLVLRPDGRWIHEANPGHLLSVLAGIRFFEHDGYFSYHSFSTAPALRRGVLDIHTSNDMIGFQLGGEYIEQFATWSCGVRGKTGVYVNSIETRQDILAVDPVFDNADRSEHANEDALSFLGEFSVFAKYNIRPNLALRVAYESLYLNTVAFTAEQIQLDAGSPLHVLASGSEMYQGFSVGLEGTW